MVHRSEYLVGAQMADTVRQQLEAQERFRRSAPRIPRETNGPGPLTWLALGVVGLACFYAFAVLAGTALQALGLR